MTKMPETLEQLALTKATLVRSLQAALDEVLINLNAAMSSAFESAVSGEESVVGKTNHDGNNYKPLWMTAECASKPKNGPNSRATQVNVIMSTEPIDAGVQVRIVTRLNSGTCRRGVRPQEVRERAKQSALGSNEGIPEREAPTGPNHWDLWETMTPFADIATDTEHVRIALDQHLTVLRHAVAAYDQANAEAKEAGG